MKEDFKRFIRYEHKTEVQRTHQQQEMDAFLYFFERAKNLYGHINMVTVLMEIYGMMGKLNQLDVYECTLI